MTLQLFHKPNASADLVRSSLVSRHTESRDESWKAWASEPKGAVQAPAVGIIGPWSGLGGADKAQNHCPRLEGLVPEFLRHRCLDTMNSLIINSLARIRRATEFWPFANDPEE